jgi:hypothetical protein
MQRSLNPFNPRAWWRRGAPPDAQAEQQAEQQARIDAKLRAIERQGSASVHFAHGLAYLLVVAFSAGSLIALAGDALRTFLAQAQHGTLDIPSLISFIVSFVLVFAMDTAMVIAASNVRMLLQRHQSGARVHVVMIIGVCVLESATYLYMSYVYDHPIGLVAWAILTARAIAAPIVAVYLSLSSTLPVSARDINTQVEVATGRGVLMEMTRIADDPRATTERKVALYRASAIMDATDAQRLDAIIEAERATRADRADRAGAAPYPALAAQVSAPPALLHRAHVTTPRGVQGAPTAAQTVAANNATRRAQLERDMLDAESYYADESTALNVLDVPDDLDDPDDPDAFDMAYEERPAHVTRPRQRASMSQRTAARDGATAARIAPRFSELAFDLPEGKTARREDTPEARRVMNYLDKHQGATIADVMKGARVSKPTARRHYGVWIERNRKDGMTAAPLTQEMPAILTPPPSAPAVEFAAEFAEQA